MLVALNKEKEAQRDDCLKTRNRVFTNQNFDLGLPSIQNYEKLLFKLPNGEGNSNRHQYSCMENPMDGGAWWATVLGVSKSQTWLSDFIFTFHFHALEKEMATHSSVLAWRIPGMGEPGGLLSMGSHRVGHDWSDLAAAAAASCLFMAFCYSSWADKHRS